MDVGVDGVHIKIIASGYMKGSMKTPVARGASRSAARLRLVHVSVRNEGHELFQ